MFKGAWFQSKQDMLSESAEIRNSVQGTLEGRQVLQHLGKHEVVLSNYTQYFVADMVDGFSDMITFTPGVGAPCPPSLEPCLFWSETYWEYDCRKQTSKFVVRTLSISISYRSLTM